MEIKPEAQPVVATEDFWYMITKGGYIKPRAFLDDGDAATVEAAIATLQDFNDSLRATGKLEEY